MPTKTHWKMLQDNNYLGSYAFQPGEEKIVTVKNVKREIVQNQNGQEECTVAYFEEDIKPLILNKTNASMIAKVWGTPYIEDWIGRRIALKVKRIKAFGEMVDAVRVSSERPTDTTYVCETCGKVITPSAGKTAEAIVAATKQKFGKTMCIECAKKED